MRFDLFHGRNLTESAGTMSFNEKLIGICDDEDEDDPIGLNEVENFLDDACLNYEHGHTTIYYYSTIP